MDWLSNIFKGLSSTIGNMFGGAGKAVGGIARGVGNVASGLGTQAGNIVNTLGSTIGKGSSSLMNMFNPQQAAPKVSTANNVFQGVGNVSQAGQQAINNATSSFGINPNLLQSPRQITSQALNKVPGSTTNIGQGNLNFKTPGIAPVTNLFQPAQQAIQQQAQAGQAVAPVAQATQPQAKPAGFIQNLFQPGGMFGQNPAQTLGGLALAGGAQMFGRTPQVPDLSQLPSYQALRNVRFDNFQQLDPALQTALENDMKKMEDAEMQQFVAAYKNLRPNADIESDSKYKQDLQDLQDMQFQRRSDTMAKARYDFIQQQIGASQAEMQKLTQLAQLDTQQIGMQLGIDAQAAQNFQDLFGSLGKSMIASGTGANDMSAIQNLFAPKQEGGM